MRRRLGAARTHAEFRLRSRRQLTPATSRPLTDPLAYLPRRSGRPVQPAGPLAESGHAVERASDVVREQLKLLHRGKWPPSTWSVQWSTTFRGSIVRRMRGWASTAAIADGTPIVVVLDWSLVGDRGPRPWRGLWLVLPCPICWLFVVLVRGVTDGWVPYARANEDRLSPFERNLVFRARGSSTVGRSQSQRQGDQGRGRRPRSVKTFFATKVAFSARGNPQ